MIEALIHLLGFLYQARGRMLDALVTLPLDQLIIVGLVGVPQHGLCSVKCGKLDTCSQQGVTCSEAAVNGAFQSPHSLIMSLNSFAAQTQL